MKFVIEANIPYIRGIFESYATVEYVAPADFNADIIKDADAIIVRTRTHCTESLLAGSKCQFIGTATIGTDHIDLDWCARNEIHVENAPGCNAPAVAQYVLSTIGHWMRSEGITSPSGLTLGIVGVGHVGSIIEHWAREFGFKLLLCDPPRANNGESRFVDIGTIAQQADIITFHTPLTKEGKYATYHLCDSAFINSLAHCKLLINSARGGIVDNVALAEAMKYGTIKNVAIDCWEGEPNINSYILENAFTATPHIAGYSSDGKHRATDMMIDAVTRYFKLPIELKHIDMGNIKIPTFERVIESYNPGIDTKALRANPKSFEALRNHYDLRPEA